MNASQPSTRVRSLSQWHLSAACLFALIAGCTQPRSDPYIVDAIQSQSGSTIVIETHPDRVAWAITPSAVRQCGRAPVSLSDDGQWVAALALNDPAQIAVTRLDSPQSVESRLLTTSCIPMPAGKTIQILRWNPPRLAVGLAATPRTESQPIDRWVVFSVDAGRCESCDPPCREWAVIDSDTNQRVVGQDRNGHREFATRSGMKIVQTIPKDDRASIVRINPDGTRTTVLHEESGRFWSRRFANAGFQYP